MCQISIPFIFVIMFQVLLYAPAFALVFYKHCGFSVTVALIAWCGIIQVALGAPFLMHAPINYVSKSFELSRVFFYKWTVNFKFLAEDVFLSPNLSRLLLILTLIAWSFVVYRSMKVPVKAFTPQQCVGICFTCNFIGILFSRTLHYQFYSWYFFSIPALCYVAAFPRLCVWKVHIPVVEVIILSAIEYAFNVYPATSTSSLVLLGAHTMLFFGLMRHFFESVGRI